VKICPSCARENAEDARFCSWCAASLDAEAPSREERKVVSCLFCDLVGFTSRAERMDPEDVRGLLGPYHARVRAELERFGGTVEKYIGDAVMAVFGAPVAHEDDPERAVRAALSIRDLLAEDGDLEVRIGIATGEALVALHARPDAGEGMLSGDVVNTAARIQAAARTGSVFVDETTFKTTERAIEHREEAPIDAKGKSRPVPVWEALQARARVGVERAGGAELVGREQELTLLRETFARVARERSPQLLTLVGVPGIGKSRLVFELFETIQTGRFGLVFWRHGRSPPYGDGVTFWALGEMVKAQAGILESDSPALASEKLRRAALALVPDEAESGWVKRHLSALAGLETGATSGSGHGEAFAAWRRFFEALAEERPLVLAFEDLHWADDALLDFVDYLVDWATGVPLLVLCTARPELLARRRGWGGGKVNSSTIQLSPLSEDETAALVHALLGRAAIDADMQARLLEHAGGNPLYAEEFTRMLSERPSEAVLPETVQGLIAARLDTLPREQKELLCDAAVVGRAFWVGALGSERWTLEEHLHALERAEFVRRERRSSVAGEIEYSFRHALMRDVAYEQIPRAQRAEKHRHTAAWLESLGRTEDHAEMLAHHHGAALDYARATGLDTGPFETRARDAFREAGDRALTLNAFRPAIRFYESSLDLWQDDAPPELVLRYGRVLAIAGDERGAPLLMEAAEGLLQAGDRERAAEAYAFLTEALQLRGRAHEAEAHIATALELVRDAPPSPAKARVLTESSRLLGLQEHEGAIAVAEEAYALADTLGLTELAARALGTLGNAKGALLDFESATEDLERSAGLARSVNSVEEVRAVHNLGSMEWWRADLRRSRRHFEEAARLGEQFGVGQMGLASSSVLCSALCFTGAWDEALTLADDLLERIESGSANYFEYHPRTVRARIRLARGAEEQLVLHDARRAVELGRSASDTQVLVPPLSTLVLVAAELDRLDEATDAARALVEAIADERPLNVHRVFDASWVADRVGCGDALRRLVLGAPADLPWRHVVLAALNGEYEQAADALAAMGHVDEAYAQLLAGERLLAERRVPEGKARVQAALVAYRPLGATRYIRRGEALLDEPSEVPA